jgi:hypothetical protein
MFIFLQWCPFHVNPLTHLRAESRVKFHCLQSLSSWCGWEIWPLNLLRRQLTKRICMLLIMQATNKLGAYINELFWYRFTSVNYLICLLLGATYTVNCFTTTVYWRLKYFKVVGSFHNSISCARLVSVRILKLPMNKLTCGN